MPASRIPLLVVAAAYGLSSMGDQLALVALTLRLHDQGQSGVAISALVIAGVLPVVVIGPLVSPLLDRVETVRLVIVVTALQAVAAGLLAFITWLPGVLLLVALLGVGLALGSPALLLLVPVLCGDERASFGFSRLESFRSAGNAAGPALAGLLVVTWGDRVALLADAASFLLMAAVLAALRLHRRPATAAARPSWLHQVRAGAFVLTRDAVLRVAIPTLATAIVFTAVLSVARVFFVRDDLNLGDVGFGVMISAHTVGMLATAMFATSRIPIGRQPLVLGLAGLLMGASLTLVAAVPVPVVALIGFTLTGAANALQSLAIRNLIHARIPEDVRGRAFAFSGAALNGAALAGTGASGPLVTLVGGAPALLIAGVGTLLATAVALPRLLRRPPAESSAVPVQRIRNIR